MYFFYVKRILLLNKLVKILFIKRICIFNKLEKSNKLYKLNIERKYRL